MQSALRAIVLLAGLLLLVASAITFGNAEPAASFASPAVLAGFGAALLGAGLLMPKQGLWRRSGAEDHITPGDDDLQRATFLQSERNGSGSLGNDD